MGIFSSIENYFGVGKKGLGQFGSDVKNIISTPKKIIDNTTNKVNSTIGIFNPQKEQIIKKTQPIINKTKEIVSNINDFKKNIDVKATNVVNNYIKSTVDFTKNFGKQITTKEGWQKSFSDTDQLVKDLNSKDPEKRKLAQEKLNNVTLTLSGEPLKNVGEKVLPKGMGIFASLFKKNEPKVNNILNNIENKVSEFNPLSYVEELTQKQRDAAQKPRIEGIKNNALNIYNDLKRKLVDSTAPIEDALREAQSKYNFKILPKNDISNHIDRTLRAPTLAGQFAKDKGIAEVIKNVDNLEALDQYLIAKHSNDVSKRGIQTGRDLTRDEQLVKSLAPQYEPYAQKITQYSHALLDYSVESGLISKDLATDLKRIYPNYIPLNRIFSELEKTPITHVGGGPASISGQTIIQKLEGSDKEIESPIASLLAKTNDAFSQGERNKTARLLASYKNLPGFEGLIKELPEGQTAKHTFSYLDNGVKKTLQTTPEIEAAAKNLDEQQLSLLGKVIAAPTRLAKAGITGLNIPFTLSNLLKDQMFAGVTSEKAIKTSILNPSVFLKSLFSALKHDELYEELVRAGGGGTSFDIARNQTPQTIEKIRSGKSIGSKLKYLVKNPSELLRSVEDVIGRSEELTRLQQFKGMKDALLKEGRTEQDATILAAKAARENTANFSRRGDWGKVLNSAFLYLNAGIQGARSFIRATARNPKGTALKVATTLFLPVAATTAWNLNDPK